MTTRTAVVYARVSTVRQAEEELPVEGQIEQCLVKAERLGAAVLQVFRDDGLSGRNGRRPGLLKALSFCETHHPDFFICWSTSRFARNRWDAALYKRDLSRAGVKMIYASQEFSDSDEGWMAEALNELMDEGFSRRVSKDTIRSMRKNAADGFWNGGRPPFGYRPRLIGKRRQLEIDAAEAPVVRTIFRWATEGSGSKEISRRLNGAGLTKRGRRWDKASVMTVLRSPAVVGDLAYTCEGELIVTPSHEPIIDRDAYTIVQQLISGRAPVTNRQGGTPRSDAVFSGLFRCGSCGEAMITETATGRAGGRYHYYNCRSWLKGKGCQSRRVPVDAIDDALLSGILDRVFEPQNLRDIVAVLKESTSRASAEQGDKVALLTAELGDVERRLHRLYESIEAGAGLALSDVAPRIRELRERKAKLDAALLAAEEWRPPVIHITEAELDAAAGLFRDIINGCQDAPRLRRFVSRFVHRVVATEGILRIEYYPDRIIETAATGPDGVSGGSYSEVRWLPDLATLRTIVIGMPPRRRAA